MSRMLLSIGVVHVLVMVVSLVRVKVLSVLLGPADYGVLSTVEQTVVGVVQLGALSLPFTAMKFMSAAHSEGAEPFERVFVAFLKTLAGLSLVAMAGVSLLLWWRPGLFGADLAPYRSLFQIALIGVPAATLHIHFMNTLASAQRGVASAWLSLAVAVTLAVCAVAGFFWGGLAGLFVATAVGGWTAAALTLRYLKRSLTLSVFRTGASALGELRRSPQIVSVSLFLYAAMSAYSLTMLATRYYVFNELGAEGAGLLQAQLGLALAVGSVITPLNGFFFTPLVNRRMEAEAKIAAANGFCSTVIAVLLLGGLVATLFPGLVLTVLFSARFLGAAETLFWFILWQSMYQMSNVFLQLLIGLDDVRFFSGITCGAYALTAILFTPLIARFGLGGAGMALLAGTMVLLVGSGTRLRARFGSGIATHVLVYGAIALGFLGVAGSVFSSATELTPSGFGLRVAYGLGAVVVYGVVLRPAEREAFLAIVRRRPPPGPA